MLIGFQLRSSVENNVTSSISSHDSVRSVLDNILDNDAEHTDDRALPREHQEVTATAWRNYCTPWCINPSRLSILLLVPHHAIDMDVDIDRMRLV